MQAATTLLTQADLEGLSPVHRAAQAGSVNLLEFLIRHGALVDESSSASKSPLLLAVESGRVEAAKFLVQQCGCDPNHVSCEESGAGRSPVQVARGSSNSSDMVCALTVRRERLVVAAAGAPGANEQSCTYSSAAAGASVVATRHASRVDHVLLYAGVITSAWCLTIVVPFYGWLAAVFVVLYIFR